MNVDIPALPPPPAPPEPRRRSGSHIIAMSSEESKDSSVDLMDVSSDDELCAILLPDSSSSSPEKEDEPPKPKAHLWTSSKLTSPSLSHKGSNKSPSPSSSTKLSFAYPCAISSAQNKIPLSVGDSPPKSTSPVQAKSSSSPVVETINSIRKSTSERRPSGLALSHSTRPKTPTRTPLTTPDLRIDLLDEKVPDDDAQNSEMCCDSSIIKGIRESPPFFPPGFPGISPEDLTPAEILEFDMKYGSPHHARGGRTITRPTLLAIPPVAPRPRVTSLPVPSDDGEDEHYRLRQFSIIGRGVVNRGDSIKSRRSRSNTSVGSDASR